MWTVGDILPVVARFAGGTGAQLESEEGRAQALQLYNDINEELLADDSWDGATAEVEFDVCEQCIALPSQFESIRAATLNQMPTPLRPSGWRYLEQGPALVDGCGLSQLTDLGDHFATARDLSEPKQLLIYSDAPEAATAQAIIQGMQPDGREIGRGQFPGMVTEPGERIAIRGSGFQPTDGTPAQPLITRATFVRRPSLVTKTVTKGHVYLLGYVEGEDPEWLATYRPGETNPSFRRYRLNVAPINPVSVIARVDLRFVPAVHDDERALIQFRPPYEIYAQAIAARRARQFDDYQRFRNSALAKLRRQREKKIESQTHIPSVSPVRSGSAIATARR